MDKKTKIISFVLISLAILGIAYIVYVYQSDLASTSADEYRAPSTLCITGKIKSRGNYVTEKCYFDTEKANQFYDDQLELEIGEPYTVTYEMGDFTYESVDNELVYKAPYQTCTSGNENGGWQLHPTGIWGFNDSLANFIRVGINGALYDQNYFSDVETQIGNNKLSQVDYHVSPTASLGDKQQFDSYTIDENIFSGVTQSKDRDYDMANEFSDWNFFDNCQNFYPTGNYGNDVDVYYGGANQPGAFSSITFTPLDTQTDGELMGQSTTYNDALVPWINGGGIRVTYNIVENLETTETTPTPDKSIPTEPTPEYTATDLDTDNDGVLNNEDPDIDGDGILNEADDTPNGETGVQSVESITTLVSTGASLWVNILVAILLIVGIGYFMFRDELHGKK